MPGGTGLSLYIISRFWDLRSVFMCMCVCMCTRIRSYTHMCSYRLKRDPGMQGGGRSTNSEARNLTLDNDHLPGDQFPKRGKMRVVG